MIYKIKNRDSLNIAADKIKNGEIIIYPTDTIYGFGVDATNTAAIHNLNKLKNRVSPYSIIVDSLDMLKKYSIIDPHIEKKLTNIFPGPYTAILTKRKSNLSELVAIDLNTIGIRIPNHTFVRDVVNKINIPIITTSINKHGSPSINDKNELVNKFSDLNIFLDQEYEESKASTIIDFTVKPNKILRGTINR